MGNAVTLEKALAIAVSVTVLIAAIVAVETRYAQSQDLNRHVNNSQITFYELYIQRAQDRLDEIEGKPAQSRLDWERKEVLRLRNQIDKYKRQIERELQSNG